jgi:hypothetical protein
VYHRSSLCNKPIRSPHSTSLTNTS